MNYNNQTVRRQDRLLSEKEALHLLKSGEYGILSMQTEEQGAYGVPVNFVWDHHHSVYIHCAPEGRKLRCIEKFNKVSFCIVGNTKIIPDQFTTRYESLVLFCEASTGLKDDEKRNALELLLKKYSPDDMVEGMNYVEQSLHRTEIIKLDIIEWSGKSKKIDL
ncbi:MAG: pyridoxamine 5'-phosphate oxidase family protein [Bacteroidales bacterium]|nr:pyridoxamine 5'-phosphate oxidase family protein [Bacteroidales bacterium]